MIENEKTVENTAQKQGKETGETKPRTFRLSNTTHNLFKQVADELGGNQDVVFARLLDAYQLQKTKLSLKSEQELVEQFENYASRMLTMFTDLVTDKENLKDTIRAEFETLLRSKDAIIMELQQTAEADKRLREMSEQKAIEAEKKLKAYLDDIVKERKAFEEREKELQDKIQSKIESCNALTESLESMKEKNVMLQDQLSEFKGVTAENKVLREQIEKSKEEVSKMKAEAIQKDADTKLTLQRVDAERAKELLELNAKHTKETEELKKELQDKIDESNQKYTSLLEKVANRDYTID